MIHFGIDEYFFLFHEKLLWLGRIVEYVCYIHQYHVGTGVDTVVGRRPGLVRSSAGAHHFAIGRQHPSLW